MPTFMKIMPDSEVTGGLGLGLARNGSVSFGTERDRRP
jgi:hypothetical protein